MTKMLIMKIMVLENFLFIKLLKLLNLFWDRFQTLLLILDFGLFLLLTLNWQMYSLQTESNHSSNLEELVEELGLYSDFTYFLW